MIKTDYIILRKIPYQESSLIVSGISPECGRLDFLLKGARSAGAKKFPFAGLFRCMNVEFRENTGSSTLFYLKSHEPKISFDAIANQPENYIAVCEYSSFLLRHTRPMLELPMTYQALYTLLSRLTSPPDQNSFALAAAKLVFLYESGFVPDETENDPGKRISLEKILDYAMISGAECPDFSEKYKQDLIHWIDSLGKYVSSL